MTERTFRIFLGAGLLIILYLSTVYEKIYLTYTFIGLLLFEGITNWRIPRLVSIIINKVFNKHAGKPHSDAGSYSGLSKGAFEAERALRLVVALLLILPFIWSNEHIWILPWFIACMLLLAGITNICPMVMFFRWMGFK